MQKKSDFKLPQIKKTHKQSSILLSKTISDTAYTPKLRPASSNKVEDLEKKLFNKLEAYQNASKKKLAKKIGKLGKQPSLESTSVGEGSQGYERLQKLMPGLYTKLVEAKKGTYVSENLISEFQVSASEHTIQTPAKLQPLEAPKPTSKREERQIPSVPKEENLFSEEQMEKIFKQYESMEGLPVQTTNRQMKQLSESINCCESNIEEIRRSMEGLVHEIGEYIGQLDLEEDLDFQKQQ